MTDELFDNTEDMTLPVSETSEESHQDRIIRTQNEKYTWVYELPMMKSFFLLFMVWKVLIIAAALVLAVFLLVNLFSGAGWNAVLGSLTGVGITLGILLVISIPAYIIVTKANNGKYTVLFEMDELGIDHTQIKTDKAKALELLTMGVGIGNKNLTAMGAGALSASGGSLYSKFSKVRKVKAYPKKGLIKLNGIFKQNQVYVDPDDFQFVYDYIMARCVNAKEI